MEGWIISIAGIILFLVLMAFGMRIGIAGGVVGLLIFLVVCNGNLDIAGKTLVTLIYGQSGNYMMTVIPLFVFMGYLALEYEIGANIFYTVRSWVGSLPGGLAVATVLGSAFFGAICGSSPVAVTLFGKIAVPEMEKAGYDWKLAVGSVSGSGGLSELIPPSTLLIMYAILANESAGKLLIAGVMPGILSALLISLMIIMRCIIKPRLGPAQPKTSFLSKIISLKHAIVGIICLVIIIGGLLTGIFTPTEAAAWSAFVMFISGCITLRGFHWKKFKEALKGTAITTAMIFLILIGIKLMSTAIISTGVMNDMVSYFTSLDVSPYVLLLVAIFIYFILGCFVGVMAMIVMTVPFFVPIFSSLGFDPIWFGVIIVIMCEIGLMTPPIGGNVFIISKVTGRELAQCFNSVWWFVFVYFVVAALLIIFPQIVLFLPNLS
ncbi:MAG: TRAP transporter large permease [Dehalococcoidales bacterium]|nr:TRAP transporter large permease [Dehalococcoidales bacterium]